MDSFLSKYAGEVANDAIQRVGEMVFSVKAGELKHIGFTTYGTLSFRLVGDGYFSLTNTGASIGKYKDFPQSTSQADIYVHATGDCLVFIKDDYTAIRSLEFFNLEGDISQFNYRKDFLKFFVSSAELTGEIKNTDLLKVARQVGLNTGAINMDLSVLVGNTYITLLQGENYGVESNISNLAGLTTLTNITMTNCRKLVGNISSFGNLVNLTTLSMNAANSLTGDTPALFVTWLGKGKTGSITITLPGGSEDLKFFGTRLNNATVTFGTNLITVVQGGNTLGTYDGTWHT